MTPLTPDTMPQFGSGTTKPRLGAAVVLVVALGALVFAGAAAAATTTLLAHTSASCTEVTCVERPVELDVRTLPAYKRWTSRVGVSLAYATRYWKPRDVRAGGVALELGSDGVLSVETFAAVGTQAAYDARLAELRSQLPDIAAQGPPRVTLGASIDGTAAIAGAYCATTPASPQDVGRRVDVVLLVAVRAGIAVRAEMSADGCGADAYQSRLLQHSDSVLNSIRWPIAGKPDPAELVSGALEPSDLAKTYGFAPLWARGVKGKGQAIAVVTWAPVPTDDIRRFDAEFGIAAPPVEFRGPATVDDEEVPSGRLEANLDIQVMRAVAPEARVLAYHAGPLMGDLVAAIERVISDGEADVLSISGGTCDVETFESGRVALRPAVRAAGERALANAVEKGITVFVASGDLGAYACQQGERSDHRISTKWPADSAYVVSVGGTLVRGNPETTIVETGWQDIVSFAGTGGGANPLDSRPPWQRAPGLADGSDRRLIPDVSAAASPDSGYAIVHDAQEVTVGGTSGAAPLWAALFSLIEQYVEQAGGPEIGFAAPVLYEVAREPVGGESPFRDVIRGGNRLHSAAAGWDAVSGLGTPDGWRLAQAILEARRP